MFDDRRVLAHADLLVARVQRIVADDPGDRSALRRTVGLIPDDPRMLPAHRIIAPFLGDLLDPHHPAVERAFYAVAAMMAAQSRAARDAETEADTGTETDANPADAGPSPSGTLGEQGPDRVVDASRTEGTAAPAVENIEGKDKPRRPNLGATLAAAVVSGALKAEPTEQRLHLLARQPLDGMHRHLPRLMLHLRGGLVPVDWGVLARDLARWGRVPRQVAKEWVQTYHRAIETAERKKNNDTGESEAA